MKFKGQCISVCEKMSGPKLFEISNRSLLTVNEDLGFLVQRRNRTLDTDTI